MNRDERPFNIVAIIQARMGSTRLPGKVLKPILSRPMLDIQLERVRRCCEIKKIIIAISDKAADSAILELSKINSIDCFRGDETNVLKRFYEAAQFARADVVVRLTADCPLIDPQIIDEVIRHYVANYPRYDYASNVFPRTFPRGMDVEVFSFDALKQAYENASSDYEKEHVTPYIIKHLRKGSVVRDQSEASRRLTVDTPEDFEVIRLLYTALYPHNPSFTLDDILAYMDDNPSIEMINAHIEQKPAEKE